MNKELLFAQTLEQIRALAKEQGNCVSQEQVQEAFAALELNGDQLQMVYDYLVKHKVGIGTPVNPDDYLSNEERDYLQDYMNELAELPTYTEGEITAFSISAMAGETSAQQRLLEVYLKDVVDVAKLYAGQGVFLEDLIGEGNVALTIGVTMVGSLEKPEEVGGMLMQMVMNAMEDCIQENADVKKQDEKIADKVNQVAMKAKELAEALHRKVTVEELREETGMSEKRILDAIRMSGFRMEDIEVEEYKDGENNV